jgi:hypothetical protein
MSLNFRLSLYIIHVLYKAEYYIFNSNLLPLTRRQNVIRKSDLLRTAGAGAKADQYVFAYNFILFNLFEQMFEQFAVKSVELCLCDSFIITGPPLFS